MLSSRNFTLGATSLVLMVGCLDVDANLGSDGGVITAPGAPGQGGSWQDGGIGTPPVYVPPVVTPPVTTPPVVTPPGSDAGVPSTSSDASVPPVVTPPPAQASCLDGITDYESAGPFKFTQKTVGKIKYWVPGVPAGCKVPVVHLANGTTASCSNYQKPLERLATHGFLAACYEDPNTGAGEYGIQALETAFTQFPQLADNKLGSTGHSQGGQASLVTLQLAEAKWGNTMTYAGLAMEPASGYGTQPTGQTWQQSYAKIKSPVFMFSGDSSTGFANSSLLGLTTGDGLVAISWVKEGFDALNKSIEAYHWTAVGATHIPTPEPEEMKISIPWFRWKLLGDVKACQFFKGMTSGGKEWVVRAEQNAKPCN